jgi:hypothetical protein
MYGVLVVFIIIFLVLGSPCLIYSTPICEQTLGTIHTGIGFITDYQRKRDLASLHSKLHNSYIKNMRISY